MILPSARAGFYALCLLSALFWSIGFEASAQTNYYNAYGVEYAIIGSLPGDQVYPDTAVSPSGGFVVWQDNITDGVGWGISARSLNGTLSGTLGTFRVNVTGTGNQQNPRVGLLKGGGAVFVWQGGSSSFQHIYARFLNASNIFETSTDILVNATTNYYQVNPAAAVLNNSNVVVVWSSFDEAGANSMQDIYGQILSPTGAKIGGEFLVNQFTSFNQRSPSVAALAGGGFVVSWISEQERLLSPSFTNSSSSSVTVVASSLPNPSIDVYARIYNSSGVATTDEILVNTANNPCASSAVSGSTDGTFMIVWAEHDMADQANSLDIFGRVFSSGGAGGTSFLVNSYQYGDQYAPRISALGLDYMVTWTSLGEDGSREGVYGQFVHNDGSLTGSQFLVNTTTLGSQMQQAVASDGAAQFLVVWTSFGGLTNGFDLYAQRYINPAAILIALPAPYVWAPFVLSNNVYKPTLVVSWAPLSGLSVSNYAVYVDGTSSPTVFVTSNQWNMTAANGLTTNSQHSFQIDYALNNNAKRSPISPSASGKTWSGSNWGGIPYEWMASYFGGGNPNGSYNTTFWPQANFSVAPNLTLSQIFLSGGNPFDSTTWLNVQFNRTAQGMFVSWNTQPGATYQVVTTTNFTTWSNVGSPRFAGGTSDSINVGSGPVGFYRVLLMR